jgi:hypothetical protein
LPGLLHKAIKIAAGCGGLDGWMDGNTQKGATLSESKRGSVSHPGVT